MKRKVILVGGGSLIDPNVVKELVEKGEVEMIIESDPLSSAVEDLERDIPKHLQMPDMEQIMIEVKQKERIRKKRINKMGRDQFKKKNRRKL